MTTNPLWEAYLQRLIDLEATIKPNDSWLSPNAIEGGWTGLNAGLVMTCYWNGPRAVVHLTAPDPALRFWFDTYGTTV